MSGVVSPLVTDVKSASEMLSQGVTSTYDDINSGELESYLDGRSRKILVSSIHALVKRRYEAGRDTKSKAPDNKHMKAKATTDGEVA